MATGLISQIMYGEESTWGTRVVPNIAIPLKSESLTKDLARLESEAIIPGHSILSADQWNGGPTTVGGSIGVTGAVVTMADAIKRTNAIIDAAKKVRKDIFFLSHGGPICTPEDAAEVNEKTECVGFVGASSLERMGVEQSLVDITRRFQKIPTPAARAFGKRK